MHIVYDNKREANLLMMQRDIYMKTCTMKEQV
jgi:hypothetical protein